MVDSWTLAQGRGRKLLKIKLDENPFLGAGKVLLFDFSQE